MVTSLGQVIDDNLLTFSFAPGYGHITLHVALNSPLLMEPWIIQIVLNRQDTDKLRNYLATVQRLDRGLD